MIFIVDFTGRVSASYMTKHSTLQRQSAENLKQIFAGPQSQFPHSCVCEWIIYSHDGSACSAGGNM